MSLIKRGSIWWVRFSHNGERIQRSTETTEKIKAQQIHDKWKAEIWNVKVLGERPNKTWREAVVKWITESQHLKSLKTSLFSIRWLDDELKDILVKDITKDIVDTLLSKLRKTNLSYATMNHHIGMLRIILRKACYEWEWIDKIPKIKLLKLSNARTRWITKDEARKLIRELSPHLKPMVELSLLTGLRQANILNLKWENVSFERKQITISYKESKSGRTFSVPLNSDAITCLEKVKGNNPVYVFTYKGNPILQASTKSWYKALDRAGIKDFRWHDLRHTAAAWHVMAGTGIPELMKLFDWSTVSMAMRYSHLSSEHLQKSADNLSGTNLVQEEMINESKSNVTT